MARTKFTKAEISWILYDVGNSALVLLATSVIPIYFNYLAAKDPAVEEVAVGAWGLAETIASLIIALATLPHHLRHLGGHAQRLVRVL